MTREEELHAMLAKARRYIASPEALRQKGDFDSAISRLFYAMFYAAEALLFSKGLTFSSHRGVTPTLHQAQRRRMCLGIRPALCKTEDVATRTASVVARWI